MCREIAIIDVVYERIVAPKSAAIRDYNHRDIRTHRLTRRCSCSPALPTESRACRIELAMTWELLCRTHALCAWPGTGGSRTFYCYRAHGLKASDLRFWAPSGILLDYDAATVAVKKMHSEG